MKNHLTVSFDYFKERRNNILSNRNTAPMLIGATLPAYNMGEMENSGFELDVNYRNNIRDFNYWGRFNYSFARNKILFQDEVPEKYAYQMRTGRRVGQFYGLLFDGFYNTWEEINALDRPVSSWNGNRLQPGDMRYVDVNKDGKIDMYDMVPIGIHLLQRSFMDSLSAVTGVVSTSQHSSKGLIMCQLSISVGHYGHLL